MSEQRCPAATETGLPCQKGDGHGGGHWFASDETQAGFESGHFDATKALAGEPFSFHAPEDCPGPPECFGGESR